MKFKLVTAIDRINYFSDAFINYYKKFFNVDEFYFRVHYKNFKKIEDYLKSHGFKNSQMKMYNIDTFGNGESVNEQNKICSEFINSGYIVLYADIDEFIYHPDLKNYITSKNAPYIAATGVVIVQQPDEPKIDKTKTVFEQRSFCKLNCDHFSKICILKQKFSWSPGRHNRPPKFPIDPEVYLFDISRICKNIIVENNKESVRIYNRVNRRYSTNSADEVLNMWRGFIPEKIVPIPKEIKDLNLF